MEIAGGRALPVILILAGGVVYHLAQKSTPARVDPFLSLFISFAAAAMACLIILVAGANSLASELRKVNWTAFALAASLLAIESGYLIGYRNGLKLNTTSLACNTAIAIALFAIGVIAYSEAMSARIVIGAALCLSGLALMSY
jgi:drug/metabolite transporter (DMT)-like permease